ncbi:hypothetical protein BIW11_02646 [Tropilaelaps mercedesae]|uniref:Uncharacterized protein n=1 Tax=Tropilaelaps mercedesae TaxID=418985 RepID=A0A1V9XZH3_9ACAR|nr:hypothetical protein BIW11_02646 [Tropilaelaps mercedesae]
MSRRSSSVSADNSSSRPLRTLYSLGPLLALQMAFLIVVHSSTKVESSAFIKRAQSCFDPIDLALAPVDAENSSIILPLEELEHRRVQTTPAAATSLESDKGLYLPNKTTLSLQNLVPADLVEVKLHGRDLQDTLWSPSA